MKKIIVFAFLLALAQGLHAQAPHDSILVLQRLIYIDQAEHCRYRDGYRDTSDHTVVEIYFCHCGNILRRTTTEGQEYFVFPAEILYASSVFIKSKYDSRITIQSNSNRNKIYYLDLDKGTCHILNCWYLGQ